VKLRPQPKLAKDVARASHKTLSKLRTRVKKTAVSTAESSPPELSSPSELSTPRLHAPWVQRVGTLSSQWAGCGNRPSGPLHSRPCRGVVAGPLPPPPPTPSHHHRQPPRPTDTPRHSSGQWRPISSCAKAAECRPHLHTAVKKRAVKKRAVKKRAVGRECRPRLQRAEGRGQRAESRKQAGGRRHRANAAGRAWL
jgi:hypothetical protein